MQVVTPNEKFDWLYSKEARNYNHIVYYSGRGSGKSWSIVDYLLWESYHKPVFTMVVRTSKVAVNTSVWKLFEDRIYDHGLQDKFKKIKDKITGHNGSLIQLFGSDDRPEDFKSIPNIDFVFWEEANKNKMNSWKIILPTTYRGGGVYNKTRNIIAFNPEYASDSAYELFLAPIFEPWDAINERKRILPHNTIVWNTHWRENRLRRPGEMEQAYARDYQADPEEAAWIWDGKLRTRSEGIVFKEGKHWSIATQQQVAEMEQFIDEGKLDCYIGADFGTNSPTCIVVMYMAPNRKAFYIRDERYKRNVDGIQDIYNMFMEIPEVQRGNQIIGDSGGATTPILIRDLKKMGLNIKGCSKKSGLVGTRQSVYPGVIWIRGLHQLCSPTCKHTINENRNYMFKKKLDGSFASDQFEDNDMDHIQDAKRYGLESLIQADPRGSKADYSLIESGLAPGIIY